MKAFLAGLMFLSVVGILIVIGILSFPLLIILGWLLRSVISLVFIIFAIWLLGKLIIFILDQLRK
jgi:hypothetical protein